MTRLLCLALAALVAVGAHAGLLEDMGINSAASEKVRQNDFKPEAPPAKPAQHSGAEGLPPLPLPAVPLRRTEKKNPPRPPVLVAKLTTADKSDWATNPADVENLLKWMASELEVSFSSINLPMAKLPSDPQEVPVLYRTGYQGFTFSDAERQKLRQYLLGGGTLILDACCGHPDFARAAMREIQTLIPERSPYRLGPDHPVYHSYYDIKEIHYRQLGLEAGARQNEPTLIGVDVGCRTAVFFFRYDASSGWDDGPYTKDRANIGYTTKTAKLLGANLMAYITSERNTATSLSQALAYVDESEKLAGKFTIAQVRYDGLWKTREAGLSMLLNTFHEKTSTPVRFERLELDLDSPKIFDVPFLYLTGHADFRLSEKERDNLRKYLSRGGILFGEACCGRSSFDLAFRREIGRVLEGSKLEALPADHLLFRFPNNATAVNARPALARRLEAKGPIPPILYGIRQDGHLAVIYSPVGLSCGWELAQCPYCEGLDSKSALALGVNILSYIVTQ